MNLSSYIPLFQYPYFSHGMGQLKHYTLSITIVFVLNLVSKCCSQLPKFVKISSTHMIIMLRFIICMSHICDISWFGHLHVPQYMTEANVIMLGTTAPGSTNAALNLDNMDYWTKEQLWTWWRTEYSLRLYIHGSKLWYQYDKDVQPCTKPYLVEYTLPVYIYEMQKYGVLHWLLQPCYVTVLL
jgi:hypothetical protein